MTPSIAVDYGFMNCTSESEYQALRDLYKVIFERKDANPLKLHEACISGALYEYVLGIMPELKKKQNRAKKFKRLLCNPYPLVDRLEMEVNLVFAAAFGAMYQYIYLVPDVLYTTLFSMFLFLWCLRES
ncbi:hypothetical protein C8R43DRAFT_1192909 [Mycena crocata]|nr:hypothetical protein C8R43DRAFT_1192909 [Mycena crocata]